MTFAVQFSPEAEGDLLRLFDFLLERATTIEELDWADAAVEAIQSAIFTRWQRLPSVSENQAGVRPGAS